ncbi:uncharacterized protein V1518DRAFT_390131 [Limtongia smithiae]|uniref:uncharacterized protein n=1 Tax=Limtongia smithiae TaxID=1125753 RepID=UPI0034CFEF4B
MLRHDVIARTQLYLLTQTLRTHLPATCILPEFLTRSRAAVPFGWHFVFFPPAPLESSLLPDGYAAVPGIDVSGMRRRWTAGSVRVPRGDVAAELMSEVPATNEIQYHNRAERVKERDSARISKVTVESIRQIKSSIYPDVVCVEEMRRLVYLPPAKPEDFASIRTVHYYLVPYKPELEHTFTPTPALSFRFCALTFNAHKIHYDSTYAREVELLPSAVLPGALSIILLLSWLQFDACVAVLLGKEGGRIKEITYDCVNVVVLNRPATMGFSRTKRKGVLRIWIAQNKGLCVRGHIEMAGLDCGGGE